MKTVFSKISLNRIFSLFTFITIALLLLIIFFAGKQYLVYRHCGQMLESSQHLLFQFTGIKNHINDTLLQNKSFNSRHLIQEIQGLDDGLNRILDDILIPEEYKLNFLNQFDLVDLTVTLRSIDDSAVSHEANQLTKLTAQLQNIHSKLSVFHQLLSRYTQKQLLGLHKALVGLLAMTIALVSIMLLVINQYITSPIIHYCKNLFPEEKDSISLFSLHKTIEALATQPVSESLKPNKADEKEFAILYRNSSIGNLLSGLSNELTNRSNGIINYTQAILDLNEDLQTESDSKQLLQKLFTEEKKMAELLVHMLQFTSISKAGAPQSLSLGELFDHITTLVQGTLKNDQIQLIIHLDNPARILDYHISDLQLVILSALQSSRAAISQNNGTDTLQKEISISVADDTIAENRVVISIQDNGAPWNANNGKSEDSPDQPWHSMTFCNDFLQIFGGSLMVIRENGPINLCIIEIPFREKTTE